MLAAYGGGAPAAPPARSSRPSPAGVTPVAQSVLAHRRQRQCPVVVSVEARAPAPLGARFVETKHRSRESLNLAALQELQPGGQLADGAPQLQLGMLLTRVGGTSVVGAEYAQVMEQLQVRPVRLTFADSMHKIMRIVTNGDLRAAYEYARGVREAAAGGAGGGTARYSSLASSQPPAHSATATTAQGASALRDFEKRVADAASTHADIQAELRASPGDAELTLWLHEVEEMRRELDAAVQPAPSTATAGRQRRPDGVVGEQHRPLSEVKKSVEKLVERSTVAADARWRTQRESRRRPDLEEKDELGSLVMNAGRRMEVLRTFFDKHDPRRSDEAIQALWETCGGKCVEYAIEEDNLAFADLMDRLKSEFGEDPLELYKAEQRKGYRTTQLSAHRLRSHKDAIREAEEAYVNSAAEAKAIEERAAEMRRRRAGTGDSVAPKVKREPHTVKVKFWSDEKVMGLSLEHWHSATRPGVRYVRVVGIAAESLAEEIVEVEKGMTIEAIDGVDVAELKERSAARSLEAIYARLRQRPVFVTFGYQIAEAAEEAAQAQSAKTQAAVRNYAGVDERAITQRLREKVGGSGAGGHAALPSFDELDVNGDGRISRLEYLQALEKKKSQVVVETVREQERAKENEQRSVASRRQAEAREAQRAAMELRKAAAGGDIKVMQATLADYEGYANPEVALAWDELELALVQTHQRERRKLEEAKDAEARAVRLEHEAADRKRLAERQRRSPARERAAAEIASAKSVARTDREREREATEAMLAEAKLEGRRRAGLVIAADDALRQVPSPRLGVPPPSAPADDAIEMVEEGEDGVSQRIGGVGAGVLGGSQRWALSGSLAESQPVSQRSSADASRRSKQRAPPLPRHRDAVTSSRSRVSTARGREGRESRAESMRATLAGGAFERMDSDEGLRRERRPPRAQSPERSTRSPPPGRSFNASGVVSNDDTTDAEPAYGARLRSRPPAGRFGHDDSSSSSGGETTPPPPPPPHPPPAGPPQPLPPSRPSRERRAPDESDYSTDGESDRLKHRAFGPRSRARSPSRGRRGSRSRQHGRHDDDGLGGAAVQRDTAVIVLPHQRGARVDEQESAEPAVNYDSALSF